MENASAPGMARGAVAPMRSPFHAVRIAHLAERIWSHAGLNRRPYGY